MRAIEIIQESIKTHRDWMHFFMKYPERKDKKEYKYIGDEFFHEKCITDYEKAIKGIEKLRTKIQELMEENEELRDRIPLGKKYQSPHEDLSDCPTCYDGMCNCDIRTLVHNIKRADDLQSTLAEKEKEIKKLTKCLDCKKGANKHLRIDINELREKVSAKDKEIQQLREALEKIYKQKKYAVNRCSEEPCCCLCHKIPEPALEGKEE
jgi:predicted  nucleic acid-binding Zn-ribbon protein